MPSKTTDPPRTCQCICDCKTGEKKDVMILISKSKESALLAPTQIRQQNITKSRHTLEGRIFLVLPYSSLQIDRKPLSKRKKEYIAREW